MGRLPAPTRGILKCARLRWAGILPSFLAARLITGRLFPFLCPTRHCVVSLGDVQHDLLGSAIGYLFGLASDLLRKCSPLFGLIPNLRHGPLLQTLLQEQPLAMEWIEVELLGRCK